MMDIKILAELSDTIFGHWNGIQEYREVKMHLKRLLGKKSISNLFEEFKIFMDSLPNEHLKKKPIYTAIFVLALFGQNLDESEQIRKYLKRYELISLLYGGLAVLIKGTKPDFVIHISTGDGPFRNKYQFLRRFEGEFGFWDYIEFFMAAKVIYEEDKEKFRRLIKEDNSQLLLLNLTSYNPEIEIPEEWIIDLMKTQDQLLQNITFYLLTKKLRRYIERLSDGDRYQDTKGEKAARNELYTGIEAELRKIEYALSQVDDRTQVSLLFNYILVEKKWPRRFSTWLLDPKVWLILSKEIRDSKKINTLEEVLCSLEVIKNKVKTSHKPYRKDMLYNATVEVMLNFIGENVGIYEWTEKEKIIFKQICEVLPKSSRTKLKKRLYKESQQLWTCKIDELIRFDIYWRDQAKQKIIMGMLAQL
ncbi:hypothetical protein [Paenibacillus sp. 1-18]|uniref:hypothetical protein n=1 Tax=Paenibacillus sp. 1-18 TaxID=1333846 RepID=UPI0004704F53|nr:hypothetical protein [Paenibacillus sp. 1-18]